MRPSSPYFVNGDDRSIHLKGVPLVAGETNSEKPVWVQVARAGEYKGYEVPFVLTADHFRQMIQNLHAHPSYKAGVNGIGSEDVISWDFEHLSDPSNFTVSTAQGGAPAQGWIQELQVRAGADGTAELWALTRWLDTARTYIKNGQYKWASVDFTFNGIHPITGESVGAVLFSVALTNQPFIEGMQPLAAKKPERVRASYYEAAENAEEALRKIRKALKLPETADVSVLGAELAKIKQWSVSGNVPLGVDLQDIFGSIRNILNLPALSSETEVLAETDKLVTRILEEQSLQIQQLPVPTGGQISKTAMVAGGEEEMPELLKALSKTFGVREAEEAVIKAAEDSIELRTKLTNSLAADKDSTTALLDAARDLVVDRDKQKERNIALSKALGVNDGEDPTARITNLLKAEKDLEELKPKFDELQKKAQEDEKIRMTSDVEKAIRVHSLPESVKEALVLLRREDPKKFEETYPLPKENQEHLLVSLTSGTQPAKKTAEAPAANTVDFNKYPGRNEAERIENYILSTVSGANKWSREKLYDEVHRLRRAQGGK